ncbi:hypothetical protein [Mycobacterium sp. E342]|nr:hypothetical protein [Mycobacterium sp. E342]
MKLEDRLAHFIVWLEAKGVILWDTTQDEEGFNPNSLTLVDEYVNT